MVTSVSNAQFKGGLENFKLIDIKVGYSIPFGITLQQAKMILNRDMQRQDYH